MFYLFLQLHLCVWVSWYYFFSILYYYLLLLRLDLGMGNMGSGHCLVLVACF